MSGYGLVQTWFRENTVSLFLGLGAFPPGQNPPGQMPPTFPQRTYPPLKLSHPVRSPHFNKMAKIKNECVV